MNSLHICSPSAHAVSIWQLLLSLPGISMMGEINFTLEEITVQSMHYHVAKMPWWHNLKDALEQWLWGFAQAVILWQEENASPPRWIISLCSLWHHTGFPLPHLSPVAAGTSHPPLRNVRVNAGHGKKKIENGWYNGLTWIAGKDKGYNVDQRH